MNFTNDAAHFAFTQTVGATASYTPNWPSTVNVGDIIILICYPDTASDVVNLVSGYTLKSSAANSIKVMAKIAGSGEAAPTITSSSSVQHQCAVIRIEAGDIDSITMATGTGSGGSNWSTPSVTAPSADNLFFYGGLATGGTSDWLSGDEPTITTLLAQQAGTSMWGGIGFDLLTASGATGTRTPWENTSGSKVTFAFTIAPSTPAVTIDDEPTDIRVTESRTARITGTGTSLTTANVDVFVNADTNTALTPTAVTLVSGNTYDVDFTVTDEYAGLSYDSVGYPIIISTPDGDATSGNIPYLPVTGNDFVNATAVPGDVIVTSGTLNIADQVEWDTVGGTVEVNEDLTFTFTGVDPEGITFDLRVWDSSDDTWGDFQTQTLTSDDSDTTPDSFSFTDVTNAGLSTVYTSNSISVSGIDASAAISISGGTYSINGGSYTGSSGTVDLGDSVTVRVTSSGSYSTAVNAVLTIGGVSDTYTVTTEAAPAPITPSTNLDKRFIMEFIQANAKASKPLGYQQIADLSAAVPLTVPAGTVYILFKPNAQAIRFRDDGTNPTASIGYPVAAGSEYVYTGASPGALRFIETTAGASLDVLYYGVV